MSPLPLCAATAQDHCLAQPDANRVLLMSNSALTLKLLLAVVLLSAGCRSWTPQYDTSTDVRGPAECIDQAKQFREAVRQAAVTNAQTQALPDLPFLHINRFLAALAKDIRNGEQQRHWVGLLAALGEETRVSENANLAQPWSTAALMQLADCARAFANSPSHTGARVELVAAVRANSPVKDAYIDAYRWLGLYALMRPVYDIQIRQLHAAERAAFGDGRSLATSRSFEPATRRPALSPATVARWLTTAKAADPLGLPKPSDTQLQRLFARHAPRLVVDYDDTNDAIATPFWQAGELGFDTARPTVYTLVSHTRIGGQNLLQLNYVFWFSERKPTTFPDFYAGQVDGLTWRVTLDHDGEVLLYDSIHNCGCYHKMFRVSDRLQLRKDPLSKEPKTIYDLTDLDPDLPATVHLQSNTHFIVGLDNVATITPQGYALVPYQALTMLPSEGATRSLFDASGLVPGSQRLERYTLWPTGVEDVGAMRQWGTHAIGFIDRQHFDDPQLLANYFHRRR